MKIEEGHQQTPFTLGDPWSRDPAFRQVTHRLLSTSPLSPQQVDSYFSRFSAQVVEGARPWTHESVCHDPRLINFDNWGRRVDRIETSEGWRNLERWSVSKGVIGEAYGKEGQEKYLGRPEYESAGGREGLDGQ
jgi:Adaptive response protein AidB N-terminal domain